MQQINVKPELGQTLGQLNGQAVLCDDAGRVLGFFSPLGRGLTFDDLQLTPPSTVEQTEELRKTKTGRPLSEILDRLGL